LHFARGALDQRIAIDQRHFTFLANEFACDRRSNAACPADHHRDAARQLQFHTGSQCRKKVIDAKT
jgi:hypothetical protein